MNERLLDELVGETSDDRIAKVAVILANRHSRRGFLGKIGRLSIAALGGPFVLFLHQDAASGAPCLGGTPVSCLCADARSDGVNQCRDSDCRGGSWVFCQGCRDPGLGVQYYRRYRDCCSTCNQGPRTGPGGCDICANQSVYCPPSKTCDPLDNCSSGQDRVFCVVSSCTSIICDTA